MNISATNRHGISLIRFENCNFHKSADKIAGQHFSKASATVKISAKYRNHVFVGRWYLQGRYTEEIVDNLIRRYEAIGYSVEVEGYGGYNSYRTNCGWF